MKLRLRTNSIRLRLTQSEVRTLRATGRIAECIHLPGGESFVYTLAAGPARATSFAGQGLVVTLESAAIAAWADTEAIAIRAEFPTPHGSLTVLVEKDFECLHRNPTNAAEDNDTFPHPKKGK